MDNLKVKMIQEQLDKLGFPDMRQDIKKGLEKADRFTVSSLRYFKHSASGSSDFLQYDVTIDPLEKEPTIKNAHLTLLRVLSSKDRLHIHVGMKQARYRGSMSPLPTIVDGYRYLKAKLDLRVKLSPPRPDQAPAHQRLFKPGRRGGKGYPMP